MIMTFKIMFVFISYVFYNVLSKGIYTKYMDWFAKFLKGFDIWENMESLYGLNLIFENLKSTYLTIFSNILGIFMIIETFGSKYWEKPKTTS